MQQIIVIGIGAIQDRQISRCVAEKSTPEDGWESLFLPEHVRLWEAAPERWVAVIELDGIYRLDLEPSVVAWVTV